MDRVTGHVEEERKDEEEERKDEENEGFDHGVE